MFITIFICFGSPIRLLEMLREMPTINVYLSEMEYAALAQEVLKKKIKISQLIRQIMRDWIASQGYGAE